MGEKAAAGHKLVSARNKLLFWICSNIASFPGQGHYLWSRGNFLDWDARFVRMSLLKSHARSNSISLAQNKKELRMEKKEEPRETICVRVKN